MRTMTAEKQRGMTVKVVTMGTGVTNVVLEEPLPLQSLLQEIGVDGQMDIRVNGATVERGYQLADGDQVLVVPRIRGGAV